MVAGTVEVGNLPLHETVSLRENRREKEKDEKKLFWFGTTGW